MTLSPWWALALAVPVHMLGERLCDRIPWLRRVNIPEPVVGGLTIAILILALNASGLATVSFGSKVSATWWTWLIRPEPVWWTRPSANVTEPLLVGFFTCIGLNATWDLVRRGGSDVALFLVLATVFGVLQNLAGVGLATLMGQSPLLGLVCGSITLTGGHGTAIGFAPLLEELGFSSAAVLGTAAATVGVVAGGLIGGPLGTALVHRYNLRSMGIGAVGGDSVGAPHGMLAEMRALGRFSWEALRHGLLIAGCIKAGAWGSLLLEHTGVAFPPQMGAMIVGVSLRNLLDATGHRWIRYEIVELFGAILLGVFLTVAMMSLNLLDLANAALPLLVIVAAQIVLMAIFAWTVTFRVMGRDFDAAMMAGGHCGFGLGATSNAMATMKVLVARHGPAPRAFLVIPVVGAILIDFTNALNITFFVNWLK